MVYEYTYHFIFFHHKPPIGTFDKIKKLRISFKLFPGFQGNNQLPCTTRDIPTYISAIFSRRFRDSASRRGPKSRRKKQ